MDPALTVMLVLFFLLAEGFFSASEFTLISFNKMKLRHLAESGDKGAGIVESLLKKPDKIFGTTSIGTNVCVFSGAAITTAYMAGIYTERADLYSFLIMGPLTLIMGEIVPKMLARGYLMATIPYLASPLVFFQKVFSPILWITSAISKLLLSLVIRRNKIPSALVTRDEILRLTKISEEKLDLASDEKKMLHRIFEFKKTFVDEAMQPLINVVAVSATATLAEAKARAAETGVSRLPVFHDRIYNIVGIISAFDILRCQDHFTKVEKIMSPAFYTPITKRNAILLREMREGDIHMSIVVDEYGAAIGIVTVEDLVEEIVGEIEDEYDSPVKFYDKISAGKFIIDAAMEIDNINDELGLDLPKGDYETMGGFVCEALERIPAKGEKMAVGSYLITILDATSTKVKSVELIDLKKEIENESAGDGKNNR